MRTTTRTVLAALPALSVAATVTAGEPLFTVIDEASGSIRLSNGPYVSPDGRVVAWKQGTATFTWTADGGVTQVLDNDGFFVRDVSNAPPVIVGFTPGAASSGSSVAVRWTEASGLETLPGAAVQSAAFGVSADGNVIVGTMNSVAIKWIDDVMTPLDGQGFIGDCRGVSSDGRVAVGRLVNAPTCDGHVGPLAVWTGSVLDTREMGRATTASADGRIVGGFVDIRCSPEGGPAIWIEDEAPQVLPLGPVPANICNDPLTVLGSSGGVSNVWTPSLGARSARDFLEIEHAIDLDAIGMTDVLITGMSDDAAVFVGFGETANGLKVWILDLDPDDVDTDGDGLFDSWEVEGIPYVDQNGQEQRYLLDIDADGVSDCDPNAVDLFVEVDAMTGLAPDGAAIGKVEQAFALSNIRLHVDFDETNIPAAGWTLDDTNNDGRDDWPTEFDDLKLSASSGTTLPGYFGTVPERDDPNAAAIREARQQAFRYCLFAKEQDPGKSTSGKGELPGNDFMVTLGLWRTPGGTPNQQAGTFMHELGHTLGLRHGGSDNTNFKPNYYSVMSYNWQTPKSWHVTGSWPLDANRRGYSFFALRSLDEASLDECSSLVGPLSSLAAVEFPHNTHDDDDEDPVVAHARYSDEINWNGDDCDFGVSVDINRVRDSVGPSPDQQLVGHDDWDVLVLGFRNLETFAPGVHVTDSGEPEEELTFEEHEALDAILPAYCHGDIDNDRVVDFGDLIEVLSSWGPCPNGCRADIEPVGFIDGVVDIDDLLAVLSKWGTCP